MTTEPHTPPAAGRPAAATEAIEMPRPTIAPLVLVAGLTLAASGVAFGALSFLLTGTALFLVALVAWVGQLLPGRGRMREAVTGPLPRPVAPLPGTVEQLVPGAPGHRLRLPEKVHPLSAGVLGGLVGGALMPAPALAYGLLSPQHSIWYPVNLLAGMVLPGVGAMTDPDLARFHAVLFVVAVVIHVVMVVFIGLMYGVMLPTLPHIPKSLAWGGLLMPLLWTAVSFLLMGFVNPALEKGVEWPWFILSQFVFGVGAAAVLMRASRHSRIGSGVLAGAVGGLLMAIPALIWSLSAGRGLWYPVNLLAGLVIPGVGAAPPVELSRFHAEWFVPALLIHAGLSAAFGVIYALLLPRLRPIPGAFTWGALLMPLLWTGASYGLMGVVNPALQRRVDWPWFAVSQFLFGLAAAAVVVRSEKIEIPPAGTGPDAAAPPSAGPVEVRP